MTVQVVCQQCGASNLGTKFCEECGAPAEGAAPPASTPATAPLPPPPPPPSLPVTLPLTVGATPSRAFLSVAFEGKPRPSAHEFAARPLLTGEFNQRARLAFIFAMSLIGVDVLATLGSFTGFYVLAYLSFVSPVLIILGLVFGHMALAQLRFSGQQGRTQAVVALVVSYAGIALPVIGIVIQLVSVAVISSTYGE
ncbi:MAG: hypothetical protein JWP19_676 [Rhodoglobus sp.]|nr:hypothetical protein [Rhodoglobus sp.]